MKNSVSPKTWEKFKLYEQLLRSWNRRTALVQQDTLTDFLHRHIFDSVQLIPVLQHILLFQNNTSSLIIDPENESSWLSSEDAPNLIEMSRVFSISQFLKTDTQLDQNFIFKNKVSLLDVGAGAGFPGMVLAMCGFKHVTLCESNLKKCLFLEELARLTDTNVKIYHERVENIYEKYDVIVSRACTDLNELCKITNLVSRETSNLGIFHKGKSWRSELNKAKQGWKFDFLIFESISSKESVLLCLKNISKKI